MSASLTRRARPRLATSITAAAAAVAAAASGDVDATARSRHLWDGEMHAGARSRAPASTENGRSRARERKSERKAFASCRRHCRRHRRRRHRPPPSPPPSPHITLGLFDSDGDRRHATDDDRRWQRRKRERRASGNAKIPSARFLMAAIVGLLRACFRHASARSSLCRRVAFSSALKTLNVCFRFSCRFVFHCRPHLLADFCLTMISNIFS